ncbi:MAG: toll/interleukin-1 receptor domain-containing protein [Burkholderiales bacterium]|nr:toll/interleukin-1 receptor domain-containing protein [Burkholderiales bacterium]
MTKLVFSYAHADEALRNELEKHLSPLRRMGLIEEWHDRRIVAGERFAREIDKNFADAQVILLLVSPDFIHSDYCYDIEMTGALARDERGEAVVIPVILKPCHWTELPFGKLQAATKNGKPIVHFPSHDDGFYEVVGSIKRAVASLGEKSRQSHAAAVPSSASLHPSQIVSTLRASTTADRSSNLRLKRTFSDLECDRALKECFDYVANFFQASLEETNARNPEISTDFTRVDAKGFEAKIYVDGKRRSQCGIWYAGERWAGDITYSSSGVTPGSYNDSIHLEDDGYSIYFKPLGMSFRRGQNRERLDQRGVAEYFWDMLIEPLQ